MSTKHEIITAIRALANDVDLDPQGRYDMLGEIAAVLSDESDTLFDENDLEDDGDEDEWEPVDNFGPDFDDELDDDCDDEFEDDDEFGFGDEDDEDE